MKIVMFTPVLKASAIGRMARLVTHELARLGHDVLVVRSEDEGLLKQEPHDFGRAPIAWNDVAAVTAAVTHADLLLYQVGDNDSFHRGCLEWLPRCPGIVCLHDFFLGHLFNGWAARHRSEAELVLRHWYGDSVAESFFELAGCSMFMERTWEASPMTEWICAMATGVITHSSWGVGRLEKACSGPVRVVPLAYDGGLSDGGQSQHGEDDGERMLNILTVGYVNANKRAASVIRAIGSSHLLRDRVIYRLVGPVANATVHELATLARNCNARLRMTGEVDEAELSRAFQQADIVCCLRWPSLEAASASAIEALLYGKAIVVTDTGFYRELPDEFVTKVAPGDEVASLRLALERLGMDPDLRNVLGDQGRDWAAATFTANNYVEEIAKMAGASARIRPVLQAAGYFKSLMASWGGAGIAPLSDPRTMFLHGGSANGEGYAAPCTP